jgi:hypothetical protein
VRSARPRVKVRRPEARAPRRCFLSLSLVAHRAPSLLIQHSDLIIQIMAALKATIDALKVVSNILGTVPVPVVQGSLKSAAELAAKLCELMQVRQTSLVHERNLIA